VIPPDCLIVTPDGELSFYNAENSLKKIVSRTSFPSEEDAEAYFVEVGAGTLGSLVTIPNGGIYKVYAVGDGGSLVPIALTVIEKITIDGIVQSVLDGAVNIPIASASSPGVVLGNLAENGISVGSDGSMSVVSLNVNKLVQSVEDELVIDGGGAAW
jgi:hypothetical protein